MSVALGTTAVGTVQYPCAYDDWSACQRDRTSQVLQVDTTKVPDGSHELLVTVTDAANNTLTSSLGTIAVANAAAAGATIGAPNGTTASRLAKISARFTTTRARVRRLRYRSTPTIRGRLVDERGQPIAGASIAVRQRRVQAGADTVQVGAVTSAADGRFSYKLAAGPSRVVSFAYYAFVGDPKPATTSSLRTSVRAIVSASISPRSVRAGRTITFRAGCGCCRARASRSRSRRATDGSGASSARSRRSAGASSAGATASRPRPRAHVRLPHTGR